MDMGIVNAQHSESDVYEKLDKELLGFIEDVLLNRCAFVLACVHACVYGCGCAVRRGHCAGDVIKDSSQHVGEGIIRRWMSALSRMFEICCRTRSYCK
jgi:hypothetical protein